VEAIIRRARPEDAPEIKGLELEGRLSPWSEKSYAAEAARDDSVFVVAEGPGTAGITGFIIMRLITISHDSPNNENTVLDGEILNLTVAPGFRRRGIARELLLRALTEVNPAVIKEIFLEVRRSNTPAIDFYVDCGFAECGVRRGFYANPVEDAVLMSVAADKVLARFRGNGLVFEV